MHSRPQSSKKKKKKKKKKKRKRVPSQFFKGLEAGVNRIPQIDVQYNLNTKREKIQLL